MFKKLIFIVIIIAVLGFLGYNYVYQEHRDIAEEEAEYVVAANEMAGKFEKNPSKSESDYLNRTIVVTGKITGLGDKSMTLDNKVFCQFEKVVSGHEVGSKIKIKGRCIGFDDLLGQVKLDQCSIIQ